ncbi:MAG TPA: M23 family metallopeptidase, partial [Spirochaetota bacterium]|nr:M23 family metallopeptidase [Spirochaetota bacterium]
MKKTLIFIIISISLTPIFSDVTSDSLDVMDNYKLTSNFGDSRYDHFHTGIDMAANDQEIRAISNCELVFYNNKRANSIRYGMGDYAIFEDSNNKMRYNYSHMKENSLYPNNVYWKRGDKVGVVGNSGRSSGDHLHFEIEDIENKKLLNPIQFIKIKDTIDPRIEDVY